MKKQWKGYQSVLGRHIEAFITHKRAVGRRFDVEERALQLLDRFLYATAVIDLSEISPELVAKFMGSRPRQRPRSYNHLLGTVRRFFEWMERQELIDASPVHMRPKRQTSQRLPFIFGRIEARRLLDAALALPDNPRASMRAITYHAIFAILYGLGLRVGEVCRLRINDVDFERNLLLIRETKFYKTRLVPFGPKIADLLRNYLVTRAGSYGMMSDNAPVFSFTSRGEIHPCTVSQVFHQLVPYLNLVIPPGHSTPRLHDLRHSFAVGTLLRWYRERKDPAAGLLHLSTFLGHVDVSSTAVYLRMTPELLTEANRRFEAYAGFMEGFAP